MGIKLKLIFFSFCIIKSNYTENKLYRKVNYTENKLYRK